MDTILDKIKANVEADFKQNCRKLALDKAIALKPSPEYGLNQLGRGQTCHYDVFAEAEKIYNWLIKDL